MKKCYRNLCLISLLNTLTFPTLLALPSVLHSKAFLLNTATDNALTSSLQTYHYTENGTTTTITATQASYFGKNTTLNPNTPAVSTTRLIDNLTGNALAQQQADDAPILTTYDALSRPTQTTWENERLTQTNYQFTQNDLSVTEINPITGYQKTTHTNPLGQIIAQCDNLASTCVRTAYNDLGQQQTSTDIAGITTQTTYDAQNRAIHTWVGVIQTATSASLTLHNQTTEFDDLTQQSTQYETTLDGTTKSASVINTYDDNQQITQTEEKTTANTPIISNTLYNNFGDKIATQTERIDNRSHYLGTYTTDAQGIITQATLGTDEARITSPTKPSMLVQLQHNLLGQLTSKTLTPTDGSPSITRYHLLYDANNQLVQKQLTNDAGEVKLTWQFAYDAKGNQIAATAANGSLANPLYRYHYQTINGEQRLISTDIAATATTHAYHNCRDYNTKNQLEAIYNSTAACDSPNAPHTNEIDYRYYPVSGWLSAKIYKGEEGATDKTLTKTYDKNTGNLISTTSIAGDTTDYTYDKASRLIQASMTTNNGLLSRNAPILRINYDYGNFTDNTFGNLRREQRWQTEAKTQQSQMIDTITYAYDDHQRRTQIAHGQPNALGLYQRINLDYQADGNLRSKTVANPNFTSYTETYAYDGYNRLTQTLHKGSDVDQTPAPYTTTYAYNNNGDLRKQHTLNTGMPFMANNAPPADKTYTYKTDGIDELTNVTYDAKTGAITEDDQGNHYTYDASNRLISYRAKASTADTHIDYYADGSRKQWQYIDNNGEHRLQFYTDADQTGNAIDTNEIDEHGNTASYFLAGGERQARITTLNGKVAVEFYGTDNKGSIVNRLHWDGNTTQTQATQYDAYGNVLATQDPTPADKAPTITYDGFGYDGEYRDPKAVDNGLGYQRARYRNFDLASFMTLDTYNFMNPRGFVEGNPTRYSDPSGHKISTSDAIVIGLGVATVFAFVGTLREIFGAIRGAEVYIAPEVQTPENAQQVITPGAATVPEEQAISEQNHQQIADEKRRLRQFLRAQLNKRLAEEAEAAAAAEAAAKAAAAEEAAKAAAAAEAAAEEQNILNFGNYKEQEIKSSFSASQYSVLEDNETLKRDMVRHVYYLNKNGMTIDKAANNFIEMNRGDFSTSMSEAASAAASAAASTLSAAFRFFT